LERFEPAPGTLSSRYLIDMKDFSEVVVPAQWCSFPRKAEHLAFFPDINAPQHSVEPREDGCDLDPSESKMGVQSLAFAPHQPSASDRRRLGRPRKELRTTNRRTQQQKHNDSAERSRARLTASLEKLWGAIPESEKKTVKGWNHGRGWPCRADIVELAVTCLEKRRDEPAKQIDEIIGHS
jgi:hypothetical protein